MRTTKLLFDGPLVSIEGPSSLNIFFLLPFIHWEIIYISYLFKCEDILTLAYLFRLDVQFHCFGSKIVDLSYKPQLKIVDHK